MCEEEEQLSTSQEEADTKVFLCVKHAINTLQQESLCIYTVDSDISIYALHFQNELSNARIFVKTGTGVTRLSQKILASIVVKLFLHSMLSRAMIIPARFTALEK